MLEDRSGTLWFGTDRGLTAYNGQGWRTFDTNNGLGNSQVMTIVEDAEGYVWVGTWGGGVSRYSQQGFTTFTEHDGLLGNEVWSICEDRSGALWLSTGLQPNVCRYDGETFTTLDIPVESRQITSICQDRSGCLWFSSFYGGLIRCDGQTYTHFGEEDGIGTRYGWAVVEDRQGNIWYGCWGRGRELL